MPQETSFENWKRAVDASLLRKCGMPSDCLPDVDYWGLYKAGDSPDEAADYAIQNAKES